MACTWHRDAAAQELQDLRGRYNELAHAKLESQEVLVLAEVRRAAAVSLVLVRAPPIRSPLLLRVSRVKCPCTFV
jgi:hypothetical protein